MAGVRDGTLNPGAQGRGSLVHAPRRFVAVAAGVAAAVTVFVTLAPWVSFAYRSPTTHVAIETAATLIAALAALLVFGRFVRTAQRADLLLAGALLLLAATNLFFSAVPALSEGSPSKFEIWTPVAGRMLAAVAFVAAAFAPAATISRPRPAIVRTVAGTVAVLIGIAALTALLQPVLPHGLDTDLSPEASGRPRIIGPPALLASFVVVMTLYAVAAIGFLRCAERDSDELMTWMAAAMAVGAFARLNYFLFPSLYSDWVYTGDILRLALYLLLLAGAFREIAGYQRTLAALAAYEERRRLARDLHDGLAQDLAFISGQSHRLDGDGRPEVAALIRQAADRALDESRRAIGALTSPIDEPLAESLVRTVEELASRAGARAEFDIDRDATASLAAREALVRIAAEAVNNSVRHGSARNVSVSLRRDNGLRLTVSDDGSGFGGEPEDGRGFGLTSMRERAEALGGRVAVVPLPGGGASIEVLLP
jgi:signal transduction histidine kinase